MLSQTGVWLEKRNAEKCHAHDEMLSNSLVSFFKKELKDNGTVIDLGCGKGDYVKNLRKNGILTDGLDGNPHTKSWLEDAIIYDLSQEIKFEKKYNWVLTLEVAEHLPKNFEEIFISNVHNNNSDGVVLSWAIEGQGGWGHFNEQNNDYVINLFEKLGYTHDKTSSDILRDNCQLSWFKQTIMIFKKT
jgi:cyclopropane fatty-acyl-phospholipid synthase-like methyltransferase